MAAMMQIESGQQGQQLNALQMKKAQQEFDTQNRLGKAWQGSINPDTGEIDYNSLLRNLAQDEIGATAIPGVIKQRKDADLAAQQLKTQQFETQKKIADLTAQMKRDLSRSPTNANIEAHFEDFVSSKLFNPQQIAAAQATRDQLLAMPLADRQPYLSSMGATASDLKPTIKDTDIGGSILPRVLDAYSGTQISQGTPIVKTPTIADKISQGNLNVTQQRLANETNPELIRLKAENTELGKLAAGQSPLAPKVIAADAGKNLVGDVATQMGNSYLKLYESSGIKSTSRGAAANLAASSQSSMLGQIGGGILGTENQSERDFIKSQRPILVQGIVKATGMTASQINSNVELKNLLDAATDPDKGYETNAKNLNLINKRFGTGKNIVPEKPIAATQSGANTVITSDGKTYTFPTPAAAAQFKQAISKIQ
jgi:hypothetical protein